LPTAGRCAIFGFVFLGHKNHKMHIAHLARCCSILFDSVRLVDVRYLVLFFLARKITRCISHISPDAVRLVDVRYLVWYISARKSQDAYRTSRPMLFGWSMCDIRFCISWPEKSQDAYRTSRPIRFGWSMCDIRFCISWPEKITRCQPIGNSSPF